MVSLCGELPSKIGYLDCIPGSRFLYNQLVIRSPLECCPPCLNWSRLHARFRDRRAPRLALSHHLPKSVMPIPMQNVSGFSSISGAFAAWVSQSHLQSMLWMVLLVIATPGGMQAENPSEKLSFNRDIRPILSDRCFLCHGPDAENRQADLRLDRAEDVHRPLEFGTASHVIKPGDPQQSEVYLRMISDDSTTQMPPPESKLELTAAEQDLVRRWIEQGAAYEGHWAFIPPRLPELPEVDQQAWGHNEIDRFILAKQAQAKLSPNPAASREKLLRRVTFDLTGLPPTLEELDAFLADQSPMAFEKVVDRLLASPAYGERMTADWLDVARYSDTFGYQVDRDRHVWPWRDWAIRAFNQNMPYDQFVTEQLAGDLLPDASDDQILATTFNRLHPQKVEGGSTPEEFRIEYVADRTQTFGTAFLGLTLECARCHDHKYDPISQAEYYQLTAFFDNIDEAGLYSFFTPSVPTPTLMLTSEAQKAQLATQREIIANLTEELQALRAARQPAFAAWQASQTDLDFAPTGELLHLDFETVTGRNQQVPGVVGSAVKLTGDDAVSTEVGNFKRSQPFSVALWMQTPDVKDRAVIFHRSRAWTDAGSRGYELLIEEGKLSAALIHFWPGNALRITTRDLIPTQTWLHVVITYDGSSEAAGLKIFLNGTEAETETIRDQLTKQITGGGGDHITIGERFRDRGFTQGLVDEFRVFERQLTPAEVAHLATPPAEASSPVRLPGEDELLAFYLARVDEPYQQKLKELEQAREKLNSLLDGLTEIMVMREMEPRKPTYRLTRGEYDKRAEQVFAATPEVFAPLDPNLPPNRLALAQWLTHPQHPLTARVAVNRIWQLLFGEGLVRTPEDFGSQGNLPTHPELLDWLSVRFVEEGWNLHWLLKTIVSSSTYQQSSAVTAEHLQHDPENLLLTRSPSFRLSAEMLRDNALAVSGLLVHKVGGAPTRPYEVEVSFKPVTRDQGEGLYRRSLYTYWKRTGPAPVMMTLDASDREVCRLKRERTSSPLQALVMFNGPQFVEASRALALRMQQRHPADPQQQLVSLFRSLTSRVPEPAEVEVLQTLLTRQQQLFAAAPEEARAYLSIGDFSIPEETIPEELAALTAVANALLNFDECVIRR